MTRKMAMENFIGRVATIIKEITRMMKEMDLVKWFGKTEVDILEIGERVYNMVLEKCCSQMDL